MMKSTPQKTKSADKTTTYKKRIGSTMYTVSVNFSDTATETMADITLRLIQNEVRNSA